MKFIGVWTPSVIILIVSFLFVTPAYAVLYAPGETLDPACAPTDVDCGVEAVAEGTTGQVPYYAGNGTALTATSSLVIISNGNVGIGTTSPYSQITIWGASNLFEAVTNASTTVFSIGQNGATTTAFAISGIASGGLLKTTTGGAIISAVLGTDYQNFSYPFPLADNATSSLTQFNSGITAYASSTIGNGTQIGGLTISGGATTTGNAYIVGTVGIGRINSAYQLDVHGTIVTTNSSVSGGGFYAYDTSGTARSLMYLDDTAANVLHIRNNQQALGGPIVFESKVGGGESARFDTLGNMGIGTTSPWAKLSVMSTAGGTTPLFVVASSTSGLATSTAMIITSSGNVGIGTAAPAGSLEVYNSVGAGNIYLKGGEGGSANLFLQADDGDDVPDRWRIAASTSGRFGVISDTTELLSVTSSGNVGIGSTSPMALLTVGNTVGTAANTPLFVVASTTGGTATATHFMIDSSGRVGIGTENLSQQFSVKLSAVNTAWFQGLQSDGGIGTYIASDASDDAYFQLRDASAVTKVQLHADGVNYINSGNVGIGTTSPYAKLSVVGLVVGEYFVGTSTATSTFSAGNVSLGSAGIRLGSGSSLYAPDNFNILDTDSSNLSRFKFSSSNIYNTRSSGSHLFQINSSQIAVFDSNGRLGVNDTSPDFRTEIVGTSGSGYFALSNAADGDIFNVDASGNVGIGTTTSTAKLHILSNNALAVNGNDSAVLLRSYNTSVSGVPEQLRISHVLGSVDISNTRSSSNHLTLQTGGGNVGIGTTTPDHTLSIFSNSSDVLSIHTNDSNSAPLIRFRNSDGTLGRIHGVDGAGIRFDYGSTEAMRINSSGNVGIGTTSPVARLTVGSTTPTYLAAANRYNSAFVSGNLEVAGLSYLGTGFMSYASSTIIGGLTVSGTATTTSLTVTGTASTSNLIVSNTATTTVLKVTGTATSSFQGPVTTGALTASGTITAPTFKTSLGQVLGLGSTIEGIWGGSISALSGTYGLTTDQSNIRNLVPATVFESAATSYTSATTLPNGNVLIAYQDMTNSSYGTFVIYDSAGTLVKSATVFESTSAYDTSATTLSNGNVLIAYTDADNSHYGTFVIYDSAGTLVKSATVFESATAYNISATTLPNGNVLIAYTDGGNSYYGTFVIYDSAGTLVKSATVFESAPTYNASATTLPNGNVLIAYRDWGNSNYGTFVIYDSAGTLVKSTTIFESAATSYTFATTLLNGNVLIAYSDDGNSGYGTFVIYGSAGAVFTDSVATNYFTATSTTATSSFFMASTSRLALNGDYVTDITGTGLTLSSGALTIDTTGNWSGTWGGIASTTAFLRSDVSDSYTAGTLTFDAGTALDLNTTTLSIADTDVAFDGASTNFSLTGDYSINTSNLVVQKATGYVGIGTTSPDTKLTIVGGDGTEVKIAASADGQQSRFGFYESYDSKDGFRIQYDGLTNALKIFARDSYVDRETRGLTILRSNGYVGIGTTTPVARLTVSGDIFATGTVYASTSFITDKGLDINPVVAPSSGSVALAGAGAGNVDDGVHYYFITFTTSLGETGVYSLGSVTVTDKSTNGKVTVTIPTSSDYRVTGRKLYRSNAGGQSYYAYYLATVSDNITTTYEDNIADSSLASGNSFWRENTTATQITMRGAPAVFIGDGAEPSVMVGKFAGATIANGTAYGGASTFVGYKAGQSITYGAKNNGFGFYALRVLTTGEQNNSIGWGSLGSLTTGSQNTSIGHNTGSSNQTGVGNVYIGYNAGYGSSGNSNSRNTLIGYYSGYTIATGTGNIALGYYAGDNITSGDQNIVIGYNVDAPSATSDNQLNIGNIFFGTNIDGVGTTLSSGNIGIGTTSPYAKLSVMSTAGGATPLFVVASSTSGLATSTAMIITSSGNVGIGTADPSYALHVSGTARTTGTLTTARILNDYNGTAAAPAYGFNNDTNTGIFLDGNSSDILGFATVGTERMRIDASGYVGVGTTSPWRTLSVAGTVAFDGLTASSAGNAVCITTSKEVTDAGGASCVPSSLRFKENVQTLPSNFAIEELNKLRVVSFDYKQGFYSLEDAPGSYGLIAEEVEIIDPLLVDYGYDGKPFTLRFDKLIGLAIQAIQEISGKIAGFAESITTAALNASVGTFSEKICVGSTCVTETQLQELLEHSGQDVTPQAHESPDPTVDEQKSEIPSSQNEESVVGDSTEQPPEEQTTDEESEEQIVNEEALQEDSNNEPVEVEVSRDNLIPAEL